MSIVREKIFGSVDWKCAYKPVADLYDRPQVEARCRGSLSIEDCTCLLIVVNAPRRQDNESVTFQKNGVYPTWTASSPC